MAQISKSAPAEGKFAGRTVGEVAADLKAGTLKAADVPVEYIVRDGKTLILNGCDRAHAIDYATFLGIFLRTPS